MMGMPDVLVLHGSPGSGKSTLARALSEALRSADVAHGVVDMDELSLVHPYPGRSFPRDNLRAIWPNYVAASPTIKLIVPMVFADEQEVGLFRAAVPGASLIICETAAPVAVLKKRVTEREPTEEWAAALRQWIDVYHARSDHERIRHFQVVTHPATVRESVREILRQTRWLG
jgi:predicted kinase